MTDWERRKSITTNRHVAHILLDDISGYHHHRHRAVTSRGPSVSSLTLTVVAWAVIGRSRDTIVTGTGKKVTCLSTPGKPTAIQSENFSRRARIRR